MKKKDEEIINLGTWNCPKSWDEVTLKQLQEIEKDEKRDLRTIIAVLTNHSVDEVNNLPLQFLDEITSEMDFIFHEPQYGEATNKITINGEEYIINTQNELKTGEYIAVDTVLKDDKRNYASILAILCRKKNEPYDSKFENEILEDRIAMFENESIMKVMALVFFFINLWTVSELPSLMSLKVKEEINLIRNRIETLKNNGELSTPYTKSLMKKLKKLEKSIKSM